MRNETKQFVQEYEVWIADDGTEFEDKEECFQYELKCKVDAMRIKSLGGSTLPPGITDFNQKNAARWQLLKNEDDVSLYAPILEDDPSGRGDQTWCHHDGADGALHFGAPDR